MSVHGNRIIEQRKEHQIYYRFLELSYATNILIDVEKETRIFIHKGMRSFNGRKQWKYGISKGSVLDFYSYFIFAKGRTIKKMF